MGDPLSVTASTIAIISFAGGSCQFLLDFFRTVSGAPKDIQHHVVDLRALRSTFAAIETLGNEIALEKLLPQEFHNRLKECMNDIQAIEMKVRKANENLERGKSRRTWAKLKWSSSADHWLSRFFTRVQTYHVTIGLDLLVLQMYVY